MEDIYDQGVESSNVHLQPGQSDSNDPDSPRTSGGGSHEAKPPKRKLSTFTDGKRKRRAKTVRRSRPGYTIQEGEDMLLIISNINKYDSVFKTKRKVCKRRVTSKGKVKVPAAKRKNKPSKDEIGEEALSHNAGLKETGNDGEQLTDSWGQNLPVELLVNIFHLVVNQEGAVPFLCRAARVCHLWNFAASNPILWRDVSVGYCWIEPGKTQLPKMELKIKNTVSWLAQNRFSQLREFSLSHWKKHVSYVVQVVSQSCPHLTSLKLSYCVDATEKTFQSLNSCPSLETINIQYSEVHIEGLVLFLEKCGNQIKKILFTYGPKIDKLLSVIARGCCPELKLLEINTKLGSGFCQLPICIQTLQSGCPKLQVFRILNITPIIKTVRRTSDCTPGFPHLEELCLATSAVSFMTDQNLMSVLHSSPKLRVLDLRGCPRITTALLAALPCQGNYRFILCILVSLPEKLQMLTADNSGEFMGIVAHLNPRPLGCTNTPTGFLKDLECLYWGLYLSSSMVSSKKGLYLLTEKWSDTLRELDLTSQPFSEEDLEIAMGNLTCSKGADLLQSLNLSSTKVNTNTVSYNPVFEAQLPKSVILPLSSKRSEESLSLSRGH
ncbi:F-box/LRR-repeat protein 6 isoform X2 [Scleropages formosus]|uniref:F-box/LRR-repeat protein 6 isoform X2 n=1 Tax=Scleropages formosus TaxID=113540 RepID=UPI0008791F59|nr:F-box/LRR-repeat protein 6 isoform X2 [Scleropages formosus]